MPCGSYMKHITEDMDDSLNITNSQERVKFACHCRSCQQEPVLTDLPRHVALLGAGGAQRAQLPHVGAAPHACLHLFTFLYAAVGSALGRPGAPLPGLPRTGM